MTVKIHQVVAANPGEWILAFAVPESPNGILKTSVSFFALTTDPGEGVLSQGYILQPFDYNLGEPFLELAGEVSNFIGLFKTDTPDADIIEYGGSMFGGRK